MAKANKRNRRRRKKNNTRMMLLGIGCGAVCAAIIAVAAWALFIRSSEDFIGRWSIDDITIYEFTDGSHGKLCVPADEFEFTYTLDKEKKSVSIDFANPNSIDKTFEYKFEGDDVLILTSSDKIDYRMRRIDKD